MGDRFRDLQPGLAFAGGRRGKGDAKIPDKIFGFTNKASDCRVLFGSFCGGVSNSLSQAPKAWYYTDPNYSIFKVATEKMEVIKALKEHIFDLQRRVEYLEAENRELRQTIGTEHWRRR